MNITATVDQSIWAVKLVATGATGTVDWYRRASGSNTHVGQGTVVWDYAADLNRAYEYVAVDDADTEVSPAVTIAADGPVLSSTTSQIAMRVTVVDARPYRGEGRSVWHPVLGRSDPFVTIHDALYPAGLLRLHMSTRTERADLINMMQRGEPMLLRSTCADVDTMVFIMTAWSDPFAGAGRKRGPAYLEIDFQRVTEVPGITPPDPDRTYQTVLDDHTTYQDAVDMYATYRDLLDGAA